MSVKLIEELVDTIEKLLSDDVDRISATEIVQAAKIYLKYTPSSDANYSSIIQTVPYINGPSSSF